MAAEISPQTQPPVSPNSTYAWKIWPPKSRKSRGSRVKHGHWSHGRTAVCTINMVVGISWEQRVTPELGPLENQKRGLCRDRRHDAFRVLQWYLLWGNWFFHCIYPGRSPAGTRRGISFCTCFTSLSPREARTRAKGKETMPTLRFAGGVLASVGH